MPRVLGTGHWNGLQQRYFVAPPQMQNEDAPVPEALEPFERQLAEAILQSVNVSPEDPARVQKLSWDGLAANLLELVKA